jgi:hypothetical protein
MRWQVDVDDVALGLAAEPVEDHVEAHRARESFDQIVQTTVRSAGVSGSAALIAERRHGS